MYRYIAKRVLLVFPTLIGAAALVFILMRLFPGDICMVRLGSGGGSFDPHALALCHQQAGDPFDRIGLRFADLHIEAGDLNSGSARTRAISKLRPFDVVFEFGLQLGDVQVCGATRHPARRYCTASSRRNR